jgi:hypothetical protein
MTIRLITNFPPPFAPEAPWAERRGESIKIISPGGWIDEIDKEGLRYNYDVLNDYFLLRCGGPIKSRKVKFLTPCFSKESSLARLFERQEEE